MSRLAIARTPLRVSFVGGGSDLPPGPGAVVSCTIDQHVYAVAKRRNDKKIYLTWREKEVVDRVEDIKHDLVREALIETAIDSGVEVMTFADIPASGSGLGSSAATLVAVLHSLFVLRGYTDEEIDRGWLAELAAKIMTERLNRFQGKQDEYACAIGGLQHIEFFPEPDTDPEKTRIDAFPTTIHLKPSGWRQINEHFLVFSPHDTSGRSADTILRSFKDPEGFRTKCKSICDDFRSLIEEEEWEDAVQFIGEHHKLKVEAFGEYEPPLLKEIATGGFPIKLCGAGGSGHLLVGCTRSTREGLTFRIGQLWGPRLPCKFVPYGTQLIYKE
jgi:D-glycero-alpha-D-manno-heptose-7-phosphate kinase